LSLERGQESRVACRSDGRKLGEGESEKELTGAEEEDTAHRLCTYTFHPDSDRTQSLREGVVEGKGPATRWV